VRPSRGLGRRYPLRNWRRRIHTSTMRRRARRGWRATGTPTSCRPCRWSSPRRIGTCARATTRRCHRGGRRWRCLLASRRVCRGTLRTSPRPANPGITSTLRLPSSLPTGLSGWRRCGTPSYATAADSGTCRTAWWRPFGLWALPNSWLGVTGTQPLCWRPRLPSMIKLIGGGNNSPPS